VDPLNAGVLPADEQDRRAWRRYWLPGISARVVRDIQDQYQRLYDEYQDLYGVTGEDFDMLLSYYVFQEINHSKYLPAIPGGRRKLGNAERLRRFIDEVLRIEVKVKPGGVAVLRDPWARREDDGGWRVELTWVRTGRQGRKPVLAGKSARLVAEGDRPMGFDVPDLERYLAAFLHKLERLPGARQFSKTAGQSRPEPGRPPKIDWYRSLRDERDRLVATGERAPAKVLAERMDATPATVRSWLKRADEYLREERKEGGEA
jgi:hypothetical protein